MSNLWVGTAAQESETHTEVLVKWAVGSTLVRVTCPRRRHRLAEYGAECFAANPDVCILYLLLSASPSPIHPDSMWQEVGKRTYLLNQWILLLAKILEYLWLQIWECSSHPKKLRTFWGASLMIQKILYLFAAQRVYPWEPVCKHAKARVNPLCSSGLSMFSGI